MSLELRCHQLDLKTEDEKRAYEALDENRRHTYAAGFSDGLLNDAHNVEGSEYAAAYSLGFVAGEGVRKRTYLNGVKDGLDDTQAKRKPENLDPNAEDRWHARVDEVIETAYRTGFMNGSSARTGSLPIRPH